MLLYTTTMSGDICIVKIALFQMNIAWENKERNYIHVEHYIRTAHEKGIECVFLPEMSFTGFSMNTDKTKEAGRETIDKMTQYAQRYCIAIGFGWVKDCGDKAENHYTVIDKNGKIISDYAKIHPFSFSGEDQKFQGGESINVFELNGMNCSTFICYDLRFPEVFQIASRTANIIIVPANWPAARREHWKCLLQARAIENQVYVIAINCVGKINGLYYSGDSCVINPNGEVLVELSDQEGVIEYELVDDVKNYRETFQVKNDRRNDLYIRYEKELV